MSLNLEITQEQALEKTLSQREDNHKGNISYIWDNINHKIKQGEYNTSVYVDLLKKTNDKSIDLIIEMFKSNGYKVELKKNELGSDFDQLFIDWSIENENEEDDKKEIEKTNKKFKIEFNKPVFSYAHLTIVLFWLSIVYFIFV